MEIQHNIASCFIDRPANLYASRAAILTDFGPVSYKDLQRLTNRVARLLLDTGCGPGDRVLIALEKSAEFIATLLGSAKVGAVSVPVNPISRQAEYLNYIAGTTPRISVVDRVLLPQLIGASGSKRMETLFFDDLPKDNMREIEPFAAARQDPALILHTSGSTNRQKAVAHSHGGVIATNRNVGEKLFGIDSFDRILCLPGPFHAFGFGFGVCFPLAAGASIIAAPARLDPEEIARLSVMHRPTILIGVPSALGALLKASRSWLSLDLSSVRFVISAGESLPPDVFAGFQEQFGLEVLDGIGSTELFHFISNIPQQAKAGSCGVPVPGCEVKLLDEEGRPVAEGAIGSLWVKIDSAFLKYWDDRKAMASTQREWTSTGDKLCREADGYFYYCGRDDDMLKIGGMWASPREMEGVLCAHADIERAFVTTREDRLGIRRLVAYIVTTDGARIGDSGVLDYLAATIPQHMLPAALIRLTELPLTLNGKINRRDLPAPVWSRECA